MKTIWLIVFHILGSLVLVAQTGTITNIEVSQRTDGTGLVDILFDFSGNGISYDINLEVSFNGGTDFNPISASHLNGDLNSVSQGTSKHVIWDGAASYPETFADKVIVKFIAIENSSGGPGETGTFTDPRDSRTYKTIKIGTQTWMAKNLAWLPSVSPSSQESYTTPYYYVYDYLGTNVTEAKATDNYQTYGVLYNWPAAMNACPTGWHLPTDADWTTLQNYLIANGYNYDGTTTGNKIAKSLATASGWTSSFTTGAVGNTDYLAYRNKSGFSALPGGYRSYSGTFSYVGGGGNWWSATELSTNYAWSRGMDYYYSSVGRNDYNKELGFSVRCVRDPETAISFPTVTTNPISEIAQTNATAGANVTNDGGAEVTTRGVVYSTYQNPTVETNEGITTNGTGTGEFTSSLTDLTPETTYYVRAYATNSKGTAYGEQVEFTTLAETSATTFTDTRDDKVYKTVTIGTQTWMAENLAYLPSVVGPGTGSQTTPYHYVYGYNGTSITDAKATTNYQTYGVLYNWPAALSACPAGWHLPTDAEWTTLENYLIANGYNYDGTTTGNKIAKSLATASGWISHTGAGSVGNTDFPEKRNATGFSALPGGRRRSNGSFYDSGYRGHWWSATEYSSTDAWLRHLVYDVSELTRYYYTKEYGFSVRCLRDNVRTDDD